MMAIELQLQQKLRLSGIEAGRTDYSVGQASCSGISDSIPHFSFAPLVGAVIPINTQFSRHTPKKIVLPTQCRYPLTTFSLRGPLQISWQECNTSSSSIVKVLSLEVFLYRNRALRLVKVQLIGLQDSNSPSGFLPSSLQWRSFSD